MLRSFAYSFLVWLTAVFIGPVGLPFSGGDFTVDELGFLPYAWIIGALWSLPSPFVFAPCIAGILRIKTNKLSKVILILLSAYLICTLNFYIAFGFAGSKGLGLPALVFFYCTGLTIGILLWKGKIFPVQKVKEMPIDYESS